LFNIGDKVVYPNQGIGFVSDIEEREFKGEKQDYYKIKIFNNTMKLTLPVNRAEIARVRLVSNSDTIDESLEGISKAMAEENEYQDITSKERMMANAEKVKSGALSDNLDIIYDLTQVMINSKLNAGEKQVLKNAKECVAEEISYAKGLSIEDSKNLLAEAIKY